MSELKKRPTLGRRNDPRPGGLLASGSKRKELLSDEDPVENAEPVIEQKRSGEILDFSEFTIAVSKYEYPRLGKIPAATFFSTIADMKVRTKEGRQILDVFYDLEDRYGQEYHILQSYPAGSQPFRMLAAALAAAGIPKGATADAGIGVCEFVTIDYVSKNSELGSIVERQPYVAPPPADEDEDEDDLLLDEDD